MPVYLCQPGASAAEPWRHGIQVYAAPFDLVDLPPVGDSVSRVDGGGGAASAPDSAVSHDHAIDPAPGHSQQQRQIIDVTGVGGRHAAYITTRSAAQAGVEIRRIRHAEVVLVDDICVAFGRHWLRLRWPGHKGGFAGYIALGKVSEPMPKHISDALHENTYSDAEASQMVDSSILTAVNTVVVESGTTNTISCAGQIVIAEEEDLRDGNEDDPTRDEEPQDNASTLSAEPFESNANLTCLRTGLIFPSSVALKLLAMYDDGLAPPVSSAPLPSEPVFCRICREGLHDDADDEQPSPAMENDAEDGRSSSRDQSSSPTPSFGDSAVETNDDGDDPGEGREPMESEPSTLLSKGPVQPNPVYHPNTHASENPMLSPCECSGSMAFVHYMCIEQWRCRSRHPEARQGLNCETCGNPYALPPPSARPANVLHMDNEDWLEAMPPHVMAALRQPHIWWQLGAAIVRRRYLRPVAPVLMSPVVALYCRARRLLKKKGVARRRWACSLCRRRARWKCVRCLRSYYCSRQCQNVSWHIVHKHVCYKPSRWAWSVVVYGIATTLLFPGILRDPLIYDAALSFIPVSFYVMAILGGGIATALKKSAGFDLRGRSFEIVVVAGTVQFVYLLWGLLGAFVGSPSSCLGLVGGIGLNQREYNNHNALLRGLHRFVLQPAERWFLMWDGVALNSVPWFRRVLCIPHQEYGCFEHSHKANADFLFDEETEGRCASDMLVVFYLLLATVLVALGNNIWKRRERQRRAARRPRAHQD